MYNVVVNYTFTTSNRLFVARITACCWMNWNKWTPSLANDYYVHTPHLDYVLHVLNTSINNDLCKYIRGTYVNRYCYCYIHKFITATSSGRLNNGFALRWEHNNDTNLYSPTFSSLIVRKFVQVNRLIVFIGSTYLH